MAAPPRAFHRRAKRGARTRAPPPTRPSTHAIRRIAAQAIHVGFSRERARGAHVERAILALRPHAALGCARLRFERQQAPRARVIVAPRRARTRRRARPVRAAARTSARLRSSRTHARSRLPAALRSPSRGRADPAPRAAISQQHVAMQRQRFQFALRLARRRAHRRAARRSRRGRRAGRCRAPACRHCTRARRALPRRAPRSPICGPHAASKQQARRRGAARINSRQRCRLSAFRWRLRRRRWDGA